MSFKFQSYTVLKVIFSIRLIVGYSKAEVLAMKFKACLISSLEKEHQSGLVNMEFSLPPLTSSHPARDCLKLFLEEALLMQLDNTCFFFQNETLPRLLYRMLVVLSNDFHSVTGLGFIIKPLIICGKHN